MADSQQLTRAKLRELDTKFKKQINPERAVEVQFNPETLKVSFANQLQTPQNDQNGQQGRQFVGAGTTKLSVTLWFDVNAPQPNGGKETDVRKLTEKVAYFITPQEDKKDKTKLLPPAVGFVWGSFSFAGMVDSMEESLEFFSPEGIPQRASVTLALSQQRITKFAFEKVNSSPPGTGLGNAPVGTRPLAQATAGSSLQSIASASGQTDWQSIAAANGIENPRLLQPGQLVDLNAGIRLPGR
jgi:hypothetical protein